MKKILGALILCLLLCGCWRYGEGNTVGYITTVEDGIFWNTVWVRSDNASSQTNGYALRKDNPIRSELEEISEDKLRVKLHFKKHVGMARWDNDARADEIISYEILK